MISFEDYKYILMLLLITMIKFLVIYNWIMYMIIFIIVATTDKTKNL